MRNLFGALALTLFVAPFGACQQKSVNGISDRLDATAFEAGYTSNGKAQLIDVRTPDEFGKGHLQGAINIDWNGSDFHGQTSKLDKSRPVYVYCLAGSRSASAARALSGTGFTEVHDMKGGYMAWTNGEKPVVGATVASKGMSQAEFDALIMSDLPVVVDFYAPWCAPCKKMMPMWEDLKTNHAAAMKVVTIDSDTHREVSKTMGVKEIPTIMILKGGKEVWRHTGLLEKDALLKALVSN